MFSRGPKFAKQIEASRKFIKFLKFIKYKATEANFIDFLLYILYKLALNLVPRFRSADSVWWVV